MNVLYCLADGTVEALYTEAIDLASLGALTIQRAVAIEFDNATQEWCVFDGFGQCLHSHRSRQACLDWEWNHLTQQREAA
jgi:hypothetical protein